VIGTGSPRERSPDGRRGQDPRSLSVEPQEPMKYILGHG
jgi:hypothetical protein